MVPVEVSPRQKVATVKVVSSRPRKHVGGSVTTAVSLATFPGTVLRNEPTLVMVHHRLQGRVGSSATTAQDGATWPEIVRQSRVVDVVVPGEVGEAGIEAVPEVMDRTEGSASTWCQQAERRR